MLSFEQASERWRAPLDKRMKEAMKGHGFLEEMATYHLETGGKRVRGLVPLWLVANMGGSGRAALDVGAAFELFHNGTLVHDDLQDDDELRRGQPTVWKRWGAPQAINLGDAFYFFATDCLESPGVPEGLAKVAGRAMAAVVGGQTLEFQMQLSASDPASVSPSIESFNRMARGKTGALFGACMEGAAMCQGVRDTASFKAWGEQIGLLFQVQDDYLDLVGDKGRERAGSDLAEGKISYPVAWTVSHAPSTISTRLETIVRTPRRATSDAMIDEAMELLEKGGGLEATKRYLLEESKSLSSVSISGYLPGFVEHILKPVAHAL
jgi:geranylgeranyl pyrophosphate synthase